MRLTIIAALVALLGQVAAGYGLDWINQHGIYDFYESDPSQTLSFYILSAVLCLQMGLLLWAIIHNKFKIATILIVCLCAFIALFSFAVMHLLTVCSLYGGCL